MSRHCPRIRHHVIAPAAVAKTITQAKPLANGESTTWHNWKITAVPMYNINHNQPNGQPFHDKGRGNGYVLNYGGKNFYFAGDTEGMPEMRALKNIDVAFIPMNLPYTMTPDEAADAVKAFQPKVAIPYHYQGSDLKVFEAALKGSAVEVRIGIGIRNRCRAKSALTAPRTTRRSFPALIAEPPPLRPRVLGPMRGEMTTVGALVGNLVQNAH